MAWLIGETDSISVPLRVRIEYDGTDYGWGSTRLLSLGNISNEAETFDEALKVSSLSFSVADTDRTVLNLFGGSSALKKSLRVYKSHGGTNDFLDHPTGFVPSLGTGEEKLVFEGFISQYKYSKGVVSVDARSSMDVLKTFELRHPWFQEQGSFMFRGSSLFPRTWMTATQRDEMPLQHYCIGSYNPSQSFSMMLSMASFYSDAPDSATYPYGTLPGNTYLHEGFYEIATLFKGRATFLGTLLSPGTLSGTNAYPYTYSGEDIADYYEGTNGTNKVYVFNRLKIDVPFDIPTKWGTSSVIGFRQNIQFSGKAGDLFNMLLTSPTCPEPYAQSKINSESIATTNRHGAFITLSHYASKESQSLSELIRNLVDSVFGRMYQSVGTFYFYAHGPLTSVTNIATYTQDSVLDFSYGFDDTEAFDTIRYKYNYNHDTAEFEAENVLSLVSSQTKKTTYNVDSLWVRDRITANILTTRNIDKFLLGNPTVTVDVPASLDDVGIGSMVKIEVDGFSDVVDVIANNIDFTDNKQEARCRIVGDFYFKRGYAAWEDVATVGGFGSTGIWGSNGTALNINEGFYGTVFKWW